MDYTLKQWKSAQAWAKKAEKENEALPEAVLDIIRSLPKPNVLTTLEDFENALEGTVVRYGDNIVYKYCDKWYQCGSMAYSTNDYAHYMYTPATVLRVGYGK